MVKTNKAANANNYNVKMINGQSRIVANKHNEEGFIVSNGKKRHNKRNGILTTGTAVSEIKSLRAKSRQFSYHIGRWDMNVDPGTLKTFISGFAQVIELVELNLHIERKYFRSFKLTVEAFSKPAILDSNNWPGGVEIKNWWPHKNKPSNTIMNKPVTHLSAIKDSSKKQLKVHLNKDESIQAKNNTDEAKINNQVINSGKSAEVKKSTKEIKSVEKYVTPEDEFDSNSNILNSENEDTVLLIDFTSATPKDIQKKNTTGDSETVI